jgi:hypothetical protein
MGFSTIKIHDDDKKELDKLKDSSTISGADLIHFSLKFVPWMKKCKKCEKPFIDHAFIFNHEFEEKEEPKLTSKV